MTLQIILAVNAFILGGLIVFGWRHARAYFQPEQHDAHHQRPVIKQPPLPKDVRQKLIEQGAARFENELNRSAEQLQHELAQTVEQLNRKLNRLGSDIVADEMRRYHDTIDSLRSNANSSLSEAREKIAAHQQELEAKLAAHHEELEAKLNEEISAEKQRRLEQLDTKLADSVMAFLAETLGHNADLGSQSKYLIEQLEAHKDDIKQGVE
ncbi:MAG TPA: hypothetical protein VFL81_02070 [Candidatus Saccharimonadales bacterium]|nr:hypothetical protein [Candidatus Saccharimonadales bacterium]